MHPVIPYVIAALLFGIACYGVLVRRNAVLLLMAVELMLNAVNLVLVTADATIGATTGQVFTLFVIVLAAAEIGVALAIVLQLYRLRRSVVTDGIGVTDGPDSPDDSDATDQTAGDAATAGASDGPGSEPTTRSEVDA